MIYKILEWNINLQSGKGMNIPDFVGSAIHDQDPDIVILTEFVFCKNAAEFLKQTFEDKGFDYYPKGSAYSDDEKNRINEILIAWRKDKFRLDHDKENNIFSQDCSKSRDVPNFLVIPLKTVSDEQALYVVGVRITGTSAKIPEPEYNPKSLEWVKYFHEQAELRYKEMEMVYAKLDEITNNDSVVLIGGDLNSYQRDAEKTLEWRKEKVLCGRKDYIQCTPSGSSWGNDSIEFPLDHFITRNCYMLPYYYTKAFMKDNNEIYKKGLDVKPPYPDHAMLIGTLCIYDITLLGDYFSDGGETYTREELIMMLYRDAGIERENAEKLIDHYVSNNWIYDAGNDCYVR